MSTPEQQAAWATTPPPQRIGKGPPFLVLGASGCVGLLGLVGLLVFLMLFFRAEGSFCPPDVWCEFHKDSMELSSFGRDRIRGHYGEYHHSTLRAPCRIQLECRERLESSGDE
jgi:hypothetical protein